MNTIKKILETIATIIDVSWIIISMPIVAIMSVYLYLARDSDKYPTLYWIVLFEGVLAMSLDIIGFPDFYIIEYSELFKKH